MTQEQRDIINNLEVENVDVQLTEKGQRYVERIKAEFVNGGIQLYKFKLNSPSGPINTYRGNPADLAWGILRSNKLSNHIVELSLGEKIQSKPEDLIPQHIYGIFGLQCSFLASGGAYSSGLEKLSSDEIIKITKDFFDEFFDQRFENFYCFATYIDYCMCDRL